MVMRPTLMETILLLYWSAVKQCTLRSRPIEKQKHFQTCERVGAHNHSIGLRSVIKWFSDILFIKLWLLHAIFAKLRQKITYCCFAWEIIPKQRSNKEYLCSVIAVYAWFWYVVNSRPLTK